MRWNGPGQLDLRRAQDTFFETGAVDAAVRSVVAASWRRSIDAGISAEHSVAPLTLSSTELVHYRGEHRLSRVFLLLHDVLGRIAEDCGCVMALGDEKGQLLWVCGQPDVLRQAEAIRFVEGTSWDERSAGTNAPGTALLLDAPVIIRASEHFNRSVQQWSCAAAPIHDPATQAILGVLDITGGEDVASPQTLGMVRAAARMAEIELARIDAVEEPRRPAGARVARTAVVAAAGSLLPTLQVEVETLGRADCSVTVGGRTLRLSPRHGEILVMLMERPDGITGEQLEVQIYEADVHPSTMRSEMTRLRALLGTGVLQSRPYRLVSPAVGDWQQVAAQLAAGRVQDAVAAYRGPLLPHSDAPGVVAVREALHRRMRAALLACAMPELLAWWTRTSWGADDLPMWQRQVELLPTGSAVRTVAAAEVERLDREQGRMDRRRRG